MKITVLGGGLVGFGTVSGLGFERHRRVHPWVAVDTLGLITLEWHPHEWTNLAGQPLFAAIKTDTAC